MSDIRALLIDLDGVLRVWPADDDGLENQFGLPSGEIRRVAFSKAFIAPAITGTVTDEEWRGMVSAELSCRHPACDAEGAILAWSESSGEVASETVSVLRSIAMDIHLVLVTNATTRLWHDLAALGLSGLFYAVVNSSSVGAAKPDSKIFSAAMEAADCSPGQALFVDDALENVQAAEALGIRGHVYESPSSLLAFLQDSLSGGKQATQLSQPTFHDRTIEKPESPH